jgi:hypothetical protein
MSAIFPRNQNNRMLVHSRAGHPGTRDVPVCFTPSVLEMWRPGMRPPLRSFLPSILGCTLWSHHHEDHIKHNVASFDSAILGNSSETTNARHREDFDWPKLEIGRIRMVEKDPERVIIVMTHHAPCINRISKPDRDGVVQQWS